MSPRRHDEVDTVSLDEVGLLDLPSAGVSRSESKAKRPRSTAFAACPECTGGGRGLVGLVRSGQHLLWRQHDYTTWSGARLPCRAAGVRLCDAPARRTGDPSVPTCLCQPR